MLISRSEFLTIRGLRYHIRHWGDVDAPVIVMLHGWMDVSASFQFIVDCFKKNLHVVAPDWRGFGLSARSGTDCYWLADYLGDLDAIVEQYSPTQAVILLGHSLGGNIACMYAGIRPDRIAKLINMEGYGQPVLAPDLVPARYRRWLAQLRVPEPIRPYASLAKVAARLTKNNWRLSVSRAAFLAPHWAHENAAGKWEILGDPAHKRINPNPLGVDDMLACWDEISAPVLWIEARDTDIWRWLGDKETARVEVERRIGHIGNLRRIIVSDAGHMLHHDQPEIVAALIEQFLD